MLAIAIVVASAGAVPVPDRADVPSLDEIDTSVGDAEVEHLALPTSQRVAAGGELWVALHTTPAKHVELVIGHDDAIIGAYDVGRASRVTEHATVDGDTFDSRDHIARYHGPILFAVRVPTTGALEQIVVFHRDAVLRVVRRPLGAATWTQSLALELDPGTTFVPVGSADPH